MDRVADNVHPYLGTMLLIGAYYGRRRGESLRLDDTHGVVIKELLASQEVPRQPSR